MNPHIRIATPDDAPAIVAFMIDFNAFEEIAWSADTGREALTKLLSDANLGVVGLVELDGAAVGYFVLTWGYDLEWNGRDAFLTELYLAPSHREKGLGGVVLSRLEEVARQHGARALHLMVRNENTRAQRLYASAGYLSPNRRFLSKVLA